MKKANGGRKYGWDAKRDCYFEICTLYGVGIEPAPKFRLYRRSVFASKHKHYRWAYTAVLWLEGEMFKGRGWSRAEAIEDLCCHLPPD